MLLERKAAKTFTSKWVSSPSLYNMHCTDSKISSTPFFLFLYIHANEIPSELLSSYKYFCMWALSLSFIAHYKYRRTVSKWPFFFGGGGGGEENRKPGVSAASLQGMVCSKCGVAFVAMCEIWFGEGCHLKEPGSAVMTAPPSTLLHRLTVFSAASVSPHHYLSILHTFSHTFLPPPPHPRSLLTSQWLFLLGCFKARCSLAMKMRRRRRKEGGHPKRLVA